MGSSVVQGLADWCERNGDSLRSLGIALDFAVSPDASRSSARAFLETRRVVWEVVVWNHEGMCDVSRALLSSGDVAYLHYERLDAEDVATLMDGLAAEARAQVGRADPERERFMADVDAGIDDADAGRILNLAQSRDRLEHRRKK